MKFFYLLLAVIIISLSHCESGPKRLSAATDLVADTGGLTRTEMEEAASKFAEAISLHFQKNPLPQGVFVALLPTKNDTSEELPTRVFDNSLVDALRKKKIYTVRIENRAQILEEHKLKQQGVTDNLSDINLKSPNFLVSTKIDESLFKSDGKRIVEQVINIELISVETNVAAWTARVPYRKQAVGRGGTGW
jgi:hypothetical protein